MCVCMLLSFESIFVGLQKVLTSCGRWSKERQLSFLSSSNFNDTFFSSFSAAFLSSRKKKDLKKEVVFRSARRISTRNHRVTTMIFENFSKTKIRGARKKKKSPGDSSTKTMKRQKKGEGSSHKKRVPLDVFCFLPYHHYYN